jgi:hypothetical protein
MGQLQISKPFESYVSVEVFPRTGNARSFQLRLLFEVEGTLNTREMTWPWTYSGSEETVARDHGVDGMREQCLREMDRFRRHLEYELGVQNSSVYSKDGVAADTLVWAEANGPPG